MINKYNGLKAVVGSAVLGITGIAANPAQAGKFNWDFSGGPTFGGYIDYGGSGSLSFKESPLSGKGEETITLSQLNQYCTTNLCQETPQFNYEHGSDIPSTFGGDPYIFDSFDGDVGFKFQSGELVGLFFSREQPFGYIGSYYEPGYGSPFPDQITEVTIELSVNGSTYNIVATGMTKVYFFDGDEEVIIGIFPEFFGTNGGRIYFTTVEPVPEPVTIIGAMTAIGFGGLFKRKLARAKK